MAESQTARALKHWRVEYCNAGERKEEIVSGASADRGETGGPDMGLSSTTQFKFAVYDADGDVKEMYTHVERVSRVPSAGEA
jgi:hypothetical protein